MPRFCNDEKLSVLLDLFAKKKSVVESGSREPRLRRLFGRGRLSGSEYHESRRPAAACTRYHHAMPDSSRPLLDGGTWHCHRQRGTA